jgi:hypothetical protein
MDASPDAKSGAALDEGRRHAPNPHMNEVLKAQDVCFAHELLEQKVDFIHMTN